MEAGPEIPPHILAKRKRKAEEAAAAAAAAAAATTTLVTGPGKPEVPSSDNSESAEKRIRVIGPAAPSAPLDEKPQGTPNQDEEDSSGDDVIGPALPSGLSHEEEERAARERLARFEDAKSPENDIDGKPQRDSWMMVPPKESDWTSRVDPTKIRARKFQTGKGAKAPVRSGGDMTLWTETPAEKQKRLNDEVMGLRRPATEAAGPSKPTNSHAEAEETARRIREYNEKHRASSLYEQHAKRSDKKEEDDPSKRVWDKDKDFALGRKVTHAQKKELMNRAAQFGDRFSSGSFL
ncbi:hypothetical protein BDZ91DRAFT_845427 [Kalaharituber pfeilii]|nr:hypothetical protein BDZ91DRAFT_845427 [Kalaharituber pfeilii]